MANKEPEDRGEAQSINLVVSDKDCEFIEANKFFPDEICRAFGVREYMLGNQRES